MKLWTRQPLLRWLSSLKLALYLLLVLAAGTAVATFIESSYGATAAKALVYNARWFEIVLILFGVNLTLNLIRRSKIGSSRHMG